MNFQEEVIARSFSTPVVVDFWAPWCGPCRVLGPVIEQLAKEQAGKWDLVKLNTEEEQEIAAQYRIRSIPNVKMFHKGEVVAEFSGALPRNAILDWLDAHLPDEQKAALEDLIERADAGEKTAIEELEEFVQQNPDRTDARVALAKHLVLSRPGEAAKLVEGIKLGSKYSDQAEDIRLIKVFMEHKPDLSPAGLALAKAQNAFRKNDLEGGILRVIEATQADKNYFDDLPRKVAIATFRLLGPAHPLTKEYRWRFDMALY